MAERGQVNKYYAPDFDPKIHKTFNGYSGVHPLRERARKIDQGIIIIRFEMPYNIWCSGCENHVGTGVRYNAEKSKSGNYYSTTIYKFRMKCHLCDNYIEMETDPANLDYKILSGARRQERRWDPKENEQIVPEDKDDSMKLAADPMFRLEHGIEDHKKKTAASSVLERLASIQEDRWKDNYACNQALRKKFRADKKVLKVAEKSDKALLEKASLSIKLVPENAKDIKLASLIKLEPTQTYDEKRTTVRSEIMSQSIFSAASSSSATSLLVPTITPKRQIAKIAQAVATRKSAEATTKSLYKEQLGIVIKSATSCETQPSPPKQKCLVADYGESDSE